VQYVNDAVANVNASGSVALSGDVGGTAGATVIGGNKITNAMLATALQAFLVPTGTVSAFAGSAAPTGYLLCDGTTTHSTTTYAALFAVVGYTYGGSGATFGVPNLKGRTVIGVGVGTEITGVLGTMQGAKEVTLSAAQSGTTAHGHPSSTVTNTGVTITDPGHVHATSQGSLISVSAGPATFHRNDSPYNINSSSNTTGITAALTSNALTIANSTAAAASSAHTNIQPSLPLNYIIKV
jgi:microcystin-dependent protein